MLTGILFALLYKCTYVLMGGEVFDEEISCFLILSFPVGFLTAMVDVFKFERPSKDAPGSSYTGTAAKLATFIGYVLLWWFAFTAFDLFDYLPAFNFSADPLSAYQLSGDQVKKQLVDNLTESLYFGMQWGLLFGIRKRAYAGDVRTVEVLRWSWQGAFSGALWGFLWGTVLGTLVMGMTYLLYGGSDRGMYDLEGVFGGMLAILVLFVCVAGRVLQGGIVNSVSTERKYPNYGIALSLKSAVLYSLALFLFLSLLICVGVFVWGVLMRLVEVALANHQGVAPEPVPLDPVDIYFFVSGVVTNALFLSYAAFLYFGGFDIIKHYVLRAWLIYKSFLPFRLIRFLDYTVRLILLRKVGGGYIFIHRLLLEYLASKAHKENRFSSGVKHGR
jgi:hypothetical protein